MDAPWRIEMLGGLRATLGDRVVTRFRSRQAGGLLAYLAYFPQRTHPREELIERLWPECDPAAGRNRFRVALASLRRQLEPPGVPAGAVLVADRANLRLNPAAVVTDVAQFEAALRAADRTESVAQQRERLAAAIDLYRGELLPGFYEDWALAERERLAEAFLQALGRLTALLRHAGDLAGALQCARRAVSADPLREEAQHELIRLLVAAGEPAAAARQYQELERLLQQELGAEPAPEIRSLIRDGERQTIPTQRGVGEGRSDHRWELPGRSPGETPTVPEKRGAEAGPAGNLPLQFTRFFGRDAEIARLVELLGKGIGPEPTRPNTQRPASNPRLVTLTGPGGTGKTRLAIEVAARQRERFHGAVWFVPLAEVVEARAAADRALEALRLPRSPHREPLEQVVAFLARQPALLLLDSFEHLVREGAALVRSLLEQAPALTCIVTSRQRLGLPGEREFPVGPLAVPGDEVLVVGRSVLGSDGSDGLVGSDGSSEHRTPNTQHPTPHTQHRTPERLLQFPSVQLFVDRAQAVRPDFQVTARNAAAVAAICARLEGIPLALELAAARARLLTPAQMLARLESTLPSGGTRFELLTTRHRELDPRHRSLWAAVDSSYQLLSPELRRCFTRLSVFRGGWALEAAEAVCGDEGDRYSVMRAGTRHRTPNTEYPAPTLDCLEQLQEASLLLVEQTEGPGAPAFGHSGVPADCVLHIPYPARSKTDLSLPDTQYGIRNLPERLTREPRYRLLDTLREYAAQQLTPEAQHDAARRHAAFYLALAEQAEPELLGPDQAAWLDRLEREHDNLRAALGWCAEAKDEAGGIKEEMPEASHPSEVGLRLAAALWAFWWVRGHLSEGRAWLSRLERPGASRAAARAYAGAGLLAHFQGDHGAARGQYEASLALGRELGDRWVIAVSLTGLGFLFQYQGEGTAARAHFEESLPIWRSLDDRWGLALALDGLGSTALEQGDIGSAQALYEESLALQRERSDPWGIALSLRNLGGVARREGDLATARARYRESLAIRARLGDRRGLAECLEGLAGVAIEQEEPARAARMLGAAQVLREAVGAPLPPVTRGECDRQVAAARAGLEEATFAAAWEQGRAANGEQTVAAVLDEPEQAPPNG